MQSRYIQSWVEQHRGHEAQVLVAALEAQVLVAALIEAVERARAEERGLVLPDLAPRTIVAPWSADALR